MEKSIKSIAQALLCAVLFACFPPVTFGDETFVADGQEIILHGRLSKERSSRLVNRLVTGVNVTILTPTEFVKINQSDSSPRRLEVLSSDPRVTEKIENFSGVDDVEIKCFIQIPKKNENVVCRAISIKNYHPEPIGKSKEAQRIENPKVKPRPTGELARIFFTPHGNYYLLTGDVVPGNSIFYRLYLNRKCDLPLKDAKDMRFLSTMPFGYSIIRDGCWYPTVDGGYVAIYKDGTIDKQPFLESNPVCMMNEDGSATILEKDFDSRTFLELYFVKKNKEQMENMRKGRY